MAALFGRNGQKGFRVKDGEKLYEFYDDGTPVKLDMFR